MKRFFILSQLFLFLPFFLFSQVNFKKSVIINMNGDSIHGFIKDMDWQNNPDKFIFTKSLDTVEKETLDINNTQVVAIDGKTVYKKFACIVSMDESKITMLQQGSDTSKVSKTIFLSILVEGCNANLYSYTDAIKTRYFYTDQKTLVPVELRNSFYYQKDDNMNVIHDKFYLRQLSYLAYAYSPESLELKNKIKSPSYSKKELTDIFSLINGGKNTILCPVNISTDKPKYQLFASSGLRISSLNYIKISGSEDLTSNGTASSSYSPYFGIGLKISSKSGSRFFIREEIRFSMDDVTRRDQYSEPLNDIVVYYVYNISQKNLSLSNIVVYNGFFTNNLKWYFGSGIDLNVSRITNSKCTSHLYGPYTDNTGEKELGLDPTRISFSIPIKVGIVFKEKMEINSSYYLPISQNNSTQLNIWEVGFSYYFTKG
jgi:hypothetical protein